MSDKHDPPVFAENPPPASASVALAATVSVPGNVAGAPDRLPAPRTSDPTPNLDVLSSVVGIGRIVAIVILGLLLPLGLVFQAYQAMDRLDEEYRPSSDLQSIAAALPEPIRRFEVANDYAMLALTYIEASNQRAMFTRQRTKVAVMHIGFAVISIGLLLIMLGIDAGGVDASGGGKEAGLSISFKVASTGVAIFLLGSAMSAGGGLLPNTYATASLPAFGAMTGGEPNVNHLSGDDFAKVLDALKVCDRDADTAADKQACFEAVWSDRVTRKPK